MNALNKLIQERFADITQGASADVYPLTKEEWKTIKKYMESDAESGFYVGTDIVDEMLCTILENRK